MEKILKFILVMIMICGLGLCFFNILSVKLDSTSNQPSSKGHYVEIEGEFICMEPGTDCDLIVDIK